MARAPCAKTRALPSVAETTTAIESVRAVTAAAVTRRVPTGEFVDRSDGPSFVLQVTIFSTSGRKRETAASRPACFSYIQGTWEFAFRCALLCFVRPRTTCRSPDIHTRRKARGHSFSKWDALTDCYWFNFATPVPLKMPTETAVAAGSSAFSKCNSNRLPRHFVARGRQ